MEMEKEINDKVLFSNKTVDCVNSILTDAYVQNDFETIHNFDNSEIVHVYGEYDIVLCIKRFYSQNTIVLLKT